LLSLFLPRTLSFFLSFFLSFILSCALDFSIVFLVPYLPSYFLLSSQNSFLANKWRNRRTCHG
jgi:hypothetical protein